jgi:hypothetical protein
MSNKNPFEIRFDTLAMAKEMLDRQYEANMTVFYQALDQARDNNSDLKEAQEKYMPKMYDPAEIMKQAQELYSFVVKKD